MAPILIFQPAELYDSGGHNALLNPVIDTPIDRRVTFCQNRKRSDFVLTLPVAAGTAGDFHAGGNVESQHTRLLADTFCPTGKTTIVSVNLKRFKFVSALGQVTAAGYQQRLICLFNRRYAQNNRVKGCNLQIQFPGVYAKKTLVPVIINGIGSIHIQTAVRGKIKGDDQGLLSSGHGLLSSNVRIPLSVWQLKLSI